VRVHAAGLDPGVWHLMTGLPYLARVMGFGLRRPRIRVRGMDVAGRIEAVGRNVTRFRPGDEVYGVCDGSFAEFSAARVDGLAPMPANLTFEQAAAVPISGCTALQALRGAGRVQAGQKVMVIGAAGGVGSFAVQMAKAFEAHVTSVCSTTKTDLVKAIGADDVIDYTRDDITAQARGYDLIIDTAGRRPLSRLRRALTPEGNACARRRRGWQSVHRQGSSTRARSRRSSTEPTRSVRHPMPSASSRRATRRQGRHHPVKVRLTSSPSAGPSACRRTSVRCRSARPDTSLCTGRSAYRAGISTMSSGPYIRLPGHPPDRQPAQSGLYGGRCGPARHRW
jgi:NADPH:quinone reductase-like Zn-dependent oxidoreductase